MCVEKVKELKIHQYILEISGCKIPFSKNLKDKNRLSRVLVKIAIKIKIAGFKKSLLVLVLSPKNVNETVRCLSKRRKFEQGAEFEP